MAPTILIVPGFWVGAAPFEATTKQLSAEGLAVEIAPLSSTGTTSPGNPVMKDDIASIRAHVEKLLDSGVDVLLVLHSAGGFLGSAAIEGLDKKAREADGKSNGVVKLVFLTGAVFPEGHEHQPLPFALVEGGASNCADPETLLFGDLQPEDAKYWTEKLESQPAEGWDGVIPYGGWKEVPSVYLVCDQDKLLPPPLQEQLAGLAGSSIERCDGGHMPMLGAVDRVVEVIKAAAA